MQGTLYLLPNRIAETPVEETIPPKTLAVLRNTRYFLAENAKTVRAFLKAAGHPVPISELSVVEIGHEPDATKIKEWLTPLEAGHDVAIVSESGCPGIADPGANIVAYAQEADFTVRPLVGPSSILLALMASGLDGQHFRFLGYLPIKEPQRSEALKNAERQSAKGETQIFIETPYRNNAFLQFLSETLQPTTRITVASDITGEQEFVKTKTAAQWKKADVGLAKVPTIFAILARSVVPGPDHKTGAKRTDGKHRPKRPFKTGDFWRRA